MAKLINLVPITEKLYDDIVASDIQRGLYTKEELQKANEWWRTTLSINDEKALLKKYHPEYNLSLQGYNIPGRIIVDIWRQENSNLEEKNAIEGGKADNKTLLDIAKKYAYDDATDSTTKERIQKVYSQLKPQLEMGIKVEREHTDSDARAREIALDHLDENPKYYSKLKKAGLADELNETKLTTVVEMIGRRRSISEDIPSINGKILSPGMSIMLKDSENMLKNHYYEPRPEFYKKLIPQIAGTVQEIEEVKSVGLIEANSIKLKGWDHLIEADDILEIVENAEVYKLKDEYYSLKKKPFVSKQDLNRMQEIERILSQDYKIELPDDENQWSIKNSKKLNQNSKFKKSKRVTPFTRNRT